MRSAGVKQKLYSFGFQRFLQLGGNLGVFARDNLWAVMKDRDATAKAAEHLAKFEADVAASEDEKVIGNSGELHERFVGQVRHAIETGNRRNAGAAADIDENFFAFEQFGADLELVRGNETRVVTIKPQVGALIHLLLPAAAKAKDDFVLLSDDFGEVDAHARGVGSPSRGVARIVGDSRAMDHGLGGRATDVDARATEVFLFDERHGPSQIREAISEGIAGLAGADDDGVIFHRKKPPMRNPAKTSRLVCFRSEKRT